MFKILFRCRFLLVAVLILLPNSNVIAHSIRSISYVSSSTGSDYNDGLSEQTAVKSIRVGLQKADTVLLKCGDSFFESVSINNKYLGNYGAGKKPILYGWRRIILPQWEKVGNNIWRLCLNKEESFTGYKVRGSSLLNNVGCLHEYDIDEIHGRRVQYLDSLRKDWDIWQTNKHMIKEMQSSDFDTLYLYLKDNPNAKLLEYSVSYSAATVINGTIDGVCFVGWGGGIFARSNAIIRNCTIDAIGGRQAFSNLEFISYGNGIEFYVNESIENSIVENNYISRCYDCAVSIQASNCGQATPRNIIIRNNIIERCCQGWEDFLRNDQNVVFENCVFENNIVLNSGHTSGFGYPYNRFKYCHVLGNNTKGDKGMIIRNNTFVGGNYYCSGAFQGQYSSNKWERNICYIKRGDYILSNYNGSKDVIRIPLNRGEFKSLKKATEDAINTYRTLTGDKTTRFVIVNNSKINRRISRLKSKYAHR